MKSRKASLRQPFRYWPQIIAGISIFLVVLALGLNSRASSPKEVELRERAARIFEYDRSIKTLPFNQLAALSMALEFKDIQGAEILITALERGMH